MVNAVNVDDYHSPSNENIPVIMRILHKYWGSVFVVVFSVIELVENLRLQS